jgi:hypothetical protein
MQKWRWFCRWNSARENSQLGIAEGARSGPTHGTRKLSGRRIALGRHSGKSPHSLVRPPKGQSLQLCPRAASGTISQANDRGERDWAVLFLSEAAWKRTDDCAQVPPWSMSADGASSARTTLQQLPGTSLILKNHPLLPSSATRIVERPSCISPHGGEGWHFELTIRCAMRRRRPTSP